jgi:hypothetical protein
MVRAEIAKAALTGAFSPCIISRTEVTIGMEDGLYDLNVNRLASDLCKMVTGEGDPFALSQAPEEEIAARLECSLMQVATGCKKGEMVYAEQLCLSQRKKEEFLNVFDKWVLLKPELHGCQIVRYRAGPLSLVKVVHVLDHVLSIAYDMKYKRDTVVKWKGKQRMHTYSPVESVDFPRLNSDLTGDKTKPYILPWPSVSPGDLCQRDLLEINYTQGLIQTGFGFLKRQAVDSCVKSLSYETPADVLRAQKRHKAFHPPT